MIIHVTQEHIERGQRNKCFECPVALAIQEQTAQQVAIVEDMDGTFIFRKMHGLWYGTKLHETISKVIQKYDYGEHMTPFQFTLPNMEAHHKVVSGSRVGKDY